VKLSELFDGEIHALQPGTDFGPARMVVKDWTVTDGETLSPYELPTAVPILTKTGSNPDPRLPMAEIEQGWGAFCVSMSSLCRVLGVDKNMHQGNTYDSKGSLATSEFIFQSKTELGERI